MFKVAGVGGVDGENGGNCTWTTIKNVKKTIKCKTPQAVFANIIMLSWSSACHGLIPFTTISGQWVNSINSF